jgi:NAD(P)-binding Rossmann-like domain
MDMMKMIYRQLVLFLQGTTILQVVVIQLQTTIILFFISIHQSKSKWSTARPIDKISWMAFFLSSVWVPKLELKVKWCGAYTRTDICTGVRTPYPLSGLHRYLCVRNLIEALNGMRIKLLKVRNILFNVEQLSGELDSMTEAPRRVAIIGGGITGSCAANHLQSLLNESTNVEIVLFDQGGRGPGGRASHRRVRRCGKISLSTVGK